MTRPRPPAVPVLNAPPGIRQRQRADGTWRVWWEPQAAARALGFKPVELKPGNPAWSRAEATRLNAELARRLTGEGPAPRAGNRTVDDLIADYRASVHWKTGLAPKTRASYDSLLAIITAKWGTRRVIDFDRAVIAAWYETLFTTRGPRQAQALIRMASILFAQAETLGWRPDNANPCQKLRLKTPPARGRVATWAEFDALAAAAEALGHHAAATALHMGLLTGQRQTDILTAPRDAFRPVQGRWVWFLRRSKRGNDGAIPVHDDLIPRIRRILSDAGTAARPRLPTDALLLDEATHAPYSENLFKHRFAAIRARAAQALPSVATLQFRDLRRSHGVFARAGGASVDDIGDVLGNSVATNPQLRETYLPASFHTAARVIAAVQRPGTATTRKKGKKE